jgi:hypothetical protein
MPLPNLGLVFQSASDEVAKLQKCDAQLPNELKTSLARILGIRFGQFSAERLDTPRVFIPFDWFFIGAALVPLYLALTLYKKPIEEIAASKRLEKEDFEKSRSGTPVPLMIAGINGLSASEYSEDDKRLLLKFINDYAWWHGSKTINRGDFHVSSLGQAANVLAASASFLFEEIVPILAKHPELVGVLMGSLTYKRVSPSSGNTPDFCQSFSIALNKIGFASQS